MKTRPVAAKLCIPFSFPFSRGTSGDCTLVYGRCREAVSGPAFMPGWAGGTTPSTRYGLSPSQPDSSGSWGEGEGAA